MKSLAVALMLMLAFGCTGAPNWHGFGVRTVTLDDRPIDVAVASTNRERAKGLSGVTGINGIDGMLFVFDEATTAEFWMKDTLLDLDIAFFDESGRLVETLTMPVCTEDPCPTYSSPVPYRWALEAPAGGLLADLGAGSTLIP
jgi:uncharacterized membrane protein (UPF0127 family)